MAAAYGMVMVNRESNPAKSKVGKELPRDSLNRSAARVWLLVDLPNWLGGQELGSRTYPRTVRVLRAIVSLLNERLLESRQSPLVVRLYSSWDTADGRPAPHLRKVHSLVAQLESDVGGFWQGLLRVIVAESGVHNTARTAGYRKAGRQKLVDTHIVSDAIFLAWKGFADEVIVASSDADMLPGLLTATAIRRTMVKPCRLPMWIMAEAAVPRIAIDTRIETHVRLETIA